MQTEVTSDRTGCPAGRRGRSGWRCRWPARWSRTWPSSTAPASAPSSSAAPTSTPARQTRCSSRAGTPWRTSARPARSGPGRCARRSAGKAGTSRTNPPSTPDPATEDQQCWVEKRAEAQQLRDQADDGRAGHGRLRRAHPRAGRGDHQGRHAREGRPGPPGPAAPVDPAPPGCPGPAPPQGQPAHGGQDLHRAGRQDLPPVAVRHPDLPVLRPGRPPGRPGRPGRLRLRPGRPGRADLRRAVRPVHPEPAPLPRP